MLAIGSNQATALRANYYQERSKVSYSGITQTEFNNFGARYNPERNATFNAERSHLSATHELLFGGGAQLLTNVYYSKFDRDWWRQQSNSTDGQCGAAFTAMRVAGQRVNVDACNSTQGRLRSYYNAGIEPRLTLPNSLGEFSASLKLHTEEQDRLQVNANTPTGRTGTTSESSLRTSDVIAGHVSQRFDLGQISITPILRYESVDAERNNRLNPAQSGSTKVTETLPGIGLTWNPQKNLTVFTSLHKGFAPPRVEDLIGGTAACRQHLAAGPTQWQLAADSCMRLAPDASAPCATWARRPPILPGWSTPVADAFPAARAYRARCDAQATSLAFFKPAEDSPEMRYLRSHRQNLGGYLPRRETVCEALPVPAIASYAQFALQAAPSFARAVKRHALPDPLPAGRARPGLARAPAQKPNRLGRRCACNSAWRNRRAPRSCNWPGMLRPRAGRVLGGGAGCQEIVEDDGVVHACFHPPCGTPGCHWVAAM